MKTKIPVKLKSYKHLVFERRGSADWILFNRPEAKNALDLEVAAELLAAVRTSLSEKGAPVLVLSGRGPDFSAGGDIKQMSGTPVTKKLQSFFLEISRRVHAAVLEMRQSDKPVLAAIPGFVGGIAFGLALGADLRVASSDARFCAATIRLGLVANGGATYHLPRLVGLGRASEILFLGEDVTAEQALRIGLVNRVVPRAALDEETQEIAERLAARPRKALGRLKRTLVSAFSSDLAKQLERERQAIAWSATTPDFREGIRAFLEKRKPQFNR